MNAAIRLKKVLRLPVEISLMNEVYMSYTNSPTLAQIIDRTNDPAYQINRIAKAIHEDADAHGLWDDFREAMKLHEEKGLEKNSLMRYYATTVVAGEVSEMRCAHPSKALYAEEMADVFIALLSTAVELEINIGKEVVAKMKINKERPWKHGK